MDTCNGGVFSTYSRVGGLSDTHCVVCDVLYVRYVTRYVNFLFVVPRSMQKHANEEKKHNRSVCNHGIYKESIKQCC